jgi:hypothetical protein
MTSSTEISQTDVNIVFDAVMRLTSKSIKLIILYGIKFCSNRFPRRQVERSPETSVI